MISGSPLFCVIGKDRSERKTEYETADRFQKKKDGFSLIQKGGGV